MLILWYGYFSSGYRFKKGGWVQMEDNRIIIRGEGLPVVMIPGLGVSSHMADEIIAKKFQNIAGYKIITLNIPGQGGLEPLKNKNDRNAKGLAHYFISLLNEYNIEKFALVGISLGGCAAIQIAAEYRGRVKALVLQGVPYTNKNMHVLPRKLFFSLYGVASIISRNTNLPVEEITEWIVNNIGKTYTRHKAGISNSNDLWNQLEGLGQPSLEGIDWDSYIDYIHFILNQDLTIIAASISKEIKTLLIDGMKPEHPLVNTSLMLAQIIPGAGEPVLVKGCGHLLPWLWPDVFINEVYKFFVKCDYT